MADSAEQPGASAPPTEAVANLHLDEVTGEKVSKSELKKRIKQRQKEEEKRAREANAPAKPVKKESAEAAEKDLTPNVSLIVQACWRSWMLLLVHRNIMLLAFVFPIVQLRFRQWFPLSNCSLYI